MISLETHAALPGPPEDMTLYGASLSSALVTIFRGNFFDAILPGRNSVIFGKDEVLYEVGARDQTFFFIRSGFIKVGTVTLDAREIIYDVRKEGGVVGELCACQSIREDRAVTLELSDVIPVPYFEIVEVLRKNPDFLGKLIEIFCDHLADAYEQINTLAFKDTAHRLTHVLLGLAKKYAHDLSDYWVPGSMKAMRRVAKMPAAASIKQEIRTAVTTANLVSVWM